MNIQSLNNSQNEPTVGKAKRLLPVCMQKQQPKQKGDEAIEIVENFGLHSEMAVTENDVCLSIKEKEELCQTVMDGCPSVIAEAMYNICLRYSAEMANKSVVVGLPILPFNQSKHSDVCQYLDYLEDLLAKILGNDEYSVCSPLEKAAKKNDILKEIKVPLCGDLLGRERVTGAKKTRMGCDNWKRVPHFG
ncbi:Hypothetical predicted protein [Paramuricea clavata]|uniref:Uncharacterized protein n=1 Tax=Paramuricea clavata TaxID=317549 RepID=A0A6S7FFS2_PARCT|nr:Hypothetical predicted protein [Paramuricea clavata]